MLSLELLCGVHKRSCDLPEEKWRGREVVSAPDSRARWSAVHESVVRRLEERKRQPAIPINEHHRYRCKRPSWDSTDRTTTTNCFVDSLLYLLQDQQRIAVSFATQISRASCWKSRLWLGTDTAAPPQLCSKFGHFRRPTHFGALRISRLLLYKRYGTDFSGYESQEQTAKAPRTGSGLRWVANKLFGSGMQGMYM